MQPDLKPHPDKLHVDYRPTGGLGEHVSVGIVASTQVAKEDADKRRTQSTILATTFVLPPSSAAVDIGTHGVCVCGANARRGLRNIQARPDQDGGGGVITRRCHDPFCIALFTTHDTRNNTSTTDNGLHSVSRAEGYGFSKFDFPCQSRLTLPCKRVLFMYVHGYLNFEHANLRRETSRGEGAQVLREP